MRKLLIILCMIVTTPVYAFDVLPGATEEEKLIIDI